MRGLSGNILFVTMTGQDSAAFIDPKALQRAVYKRNRHGYTLSYVPEISRVLDSKAEILCTSQDRRWVGGRQGRTNNREKRYKHVDYEPVQHSRVEEVHSPSHTWPARRFDDKPSPYVK